MDKYIKLSECKKGYLYRIDSRNLTFGVYNGKNGFIGIREKFGQYYLFTEYHWDQGPPFGTVKPIEEICKTPENLSIMEDLGTVESNSKRPIYWCETSKEWIFRDTEKVFNPRKDKGWAESVFNRPLFEYLENKQKQYGTKYS